MKIKKIISCVLIFAMCASIMLVSALAVAPTVDKEPDNPGSGEYETYTCNTTAVNVRSGPGSNYRSFGQLLYGEYFWHKLYQSENTFSYGKCDEFTDIALYYDTYDMWGWVSSRYLSYSGQMPPRPNAF